MRLQGVACDLNSPGFKALCGATEAVLGTVKPYSITGSLPLIRELKVCHGTEHQWCTLVCTVCTAGTLRLFRTRQGQKSLMLASTREMQRSCFLLCNLLSLQDAGFDVQTVGYGKLLSLPLCSVSHVASEQLCVSKHTAQENDKTQCKQPALVIQAFERRAASLGACLFCAEGVMATYHARNEYCLLSRFQTGLSDSYEDHLNLGGVRLKRK